MPPRFFVSRQKKRRTLSTNLNPNPTFVFNNTKELNVIILRVLIIPSICEAPSRKVVMPSSGSMVVLSGLTKSFESTRLFARPMLRRRCVRHCRLVNIWSNRLLILCPDAVRHRGGRTASTKDGAANHKRQNLYKRRLDESVLSQHQRQITAILRDIRDTEVRARANGPGVGRERRLCSILCALCFSLSIGS